MTTTEKAEYIINHNGDCSGVYCFIVNNKNNDEQCPLLTRNGRCATHDYAERLEILGELGYGKKACIHDCSTCEHTYSEKKI